MNIERHPFYEEAKELVIKDGYCSESQLQQHFKIGYNAAGRIINELGIEGIIDDNKATPRRKILIISEK